MKEGTSQGAYAGKDTYHCIHTSTSSRELSRLDRLAVRGVRQGESVASDTSDRSVTTQPGRRGGSYARFRCRGRGSGAERSPSSCSGAEMVFSKRGAGIGSEPTSGFWKGIDGCGGSHGTGGVVSWDSCWSQVADRVRRGWDGVGREACRASHPFAFRGGQTPPPVASRPPTLAPALEATTSRAGGVTGAWRQEAGFALRNGSSRSEAWRTARHLFLGSCPVSSGGTWSTAR